MSNISSLNYNNCVSCRSCEQICPHNSISFHENEEGFLYPIVGKECIDCGLCTNHCPVISPRELNWITPKRYAVILKDKAILNKSSSGGLFGGIAKYILDNGGFAFGAAYDEDMTVRNIMITNKSELEKIQGSKYVVSDTKNTYNQVKDLLNTGKKVLYGATPCQIAGLRAYLEKDYENLYTMDLICHGVPSAKIFKKYLYWLEEKYKGKIIYYGFRDKDVSGWSCGGKALVKTKTKTKTLEGACDPYYATFLRCETYRESCYTCRFAYQKNRIGDITMGDFWGTDKSYYEIPSKDGISICSVNTEQGQKLFTDVRKYFDVFYIPKDENLTVNIAYNHPSIRPSVRNTIYDGIDGSAKIYFRKFLRTSYLLFVSKKVFFKLIPRPVKNFVKWLVKWKR